MTKLFLFPLIGCLYIRYAGQRPVLAAATASLVLGALELLFVQVGAMTYLGWSTWITVVAFFAFFLLLRWVAGRPLPFWMFTGATAFIAAYLTHQLARGAFALWQYRVALPVATVDALFLLLHNGLIIAPAVLAVVTVPRLRGPAGILAALSLLLVVEVSLVWTGVLVYDGWNLWLSGVRYLLLMGITIAFAAWQREEHGEEPVRIR